jgi:hypothetical protein
LTENKVRDEPVRKGFTALFKSPQYLYPGRYLPEFKKARE